ncbi:hypothetical protein C357_18517 [Citreicella sp. 357]|nr:hypothetical protein C357_18517 [Citreicella sp. 357]
MPVEPLMKTAGAAIPGLPNASTALEMVLREADFGISPVHTTGGILRESPAWPGACRGADRAGP